MNTNIKSTFIFNEFLFEAKLNWLSLNWQKSTRIPLSSRLHYAGKIWKWRTLHRTFSVHTTPEKLKKRDNRQRQKSSSASLRVGANRIIIISVKLRFQNVFSLHYYRQSPILSFTANQLIYNKYYLTSLRSNDF